MESEYPKKNTTMKTLNILFTALLLLTYSISSAQSDCISEDPNQPCCNDQIHTYPPHAINNERPYKTNTWFDWTMENFDFVNGNALRRSADPQGLEVKNPFYTEQQHLQHINFYTLNHDRNGVRENLDFLPEDGWELLSLNLGYDVDGTPLPTTDLRNIPYFMLYNRYTAKVRLLFYTNDEVGGNSLLTSLWLDRSSSANANASGMLAHYGSGYRNDVQQTLDESTREVSIFTGPVSYQNNWNLAEFSIAYDPCVCSHESRIKFSFSRLTSSTAELYGRLIATAVPLDNTGNSPLINGKDFLANIGEYQKGDGEMKNGMLTYNNIQALVDKYKAPQLDPIIKSFINLGMKVLESYAGRKEKIVDGFISTKATDWLNQLAPGVINQMTRKDSLALQLGILGKSADFLNKQINSKIDPQVPNVSFIEGEMRIQGKISSNTVFSGNDIDLYTPGSKNTSTSSTINIKSYPIYNEALGVIGMLERPSIAVRVFEYRNGNIDFNGSCRERYEIKLSSIPHVFNPSAEVDVENSSIFIAYVLPGRFSTEEELENQIPNSSSWDISSADFSEIEDASGVPTEMISDFINLECAFDQPAVFIPAIGKLHDHDTGTEIEFSNDDVNLSNLKLRVMYKLRFKPNIYGKVQEVISYQTYKTSVQYDYHTRGEVGIDGNGEPGSYTVPPIKGMFEYPENLTLSYNNFTKDTIIYAKNRIDIHGNLMTASGVLVHIKAPVIEVHPNNMISPSIILENGMPMGCDHTIESMSKEEVKLFCNSNKYKAKNFAEKKDPNMDNEGIVTTDLVPLTLHPNPARDIVHLSGIDPEQVERVICLDALGRIIHQWEGYTAPLDVSMLQSGMYLIQVRYKDGRSSESHKLGIAR